MGKLSVTARTNILKHIFNAAQTAPESIFLCLCTADPTEDGTGATIAEPSETTGYARPAVSFGAASGRKIVQSAQVDFVKASISYPAAITHWAICDSNIVGSGNMLAYGAFSAPFTPMINNVPYVPISEIEISIGTDADSGFTDYAVHKALDFIFSGTAWTTPSGGTYIAIATATIAHDATSITEEDWTGYARVEVNKPAEGDPKWTTASAGALSNASIITISASAPPDCDLDVAMAIMDADTGGNVLCYDNANIVDQTPAEGDTVQFEAGALDISLGPEDEYWELTIVVTADDITNGDNYFGIALDYGTDISLYVDWGDGSEIEHGTTDDTYHEYATPGTYKIKVTGSVTNGAIWVYSGYTNLIATSAINGVTGLIGFHNMFAYHQALESVPGDLFKNFPSAAGNTETSSSYGCFYETFYECSLLDNLPDDLFRYQTLVTGDYAFYETFYQCTALSTLPSGLFKYNTAITDLLYTFEGCSSLATIPADLFKYNTALNYMDETFSECGLTEIPAGLFDYNTELEHLNMVFLDCTSLTTIPADLFKYNTKMLEFWVTFAGCSALEEIPTDLFRYNVLATNFASVFRECSTLTSIPTDLFRYNVLATIFLQTFSGCTGLLTVPANLFKYNTLATNFSYTFYLCNNLQQNANIFYADGEQSTRFAGQTINFSKCFNILAAFTGTQGTAPDIWNCTGTFTKTDCWQGHGTGSLTNWDSVPTEWR